MYLTMQFYIPFLQIFFVVRRTDSHFDTLWGTAIVRVQKIRL